MVGRCNVDPSRLTCIAHSMGGLISLMTVADGWAKSRFQRLVVCSPMVKMKVTLALCPVHCSQHISVVIIFSTLDFLEGYGARDTEICVVGSKSSRNVIRCTLSTGFCFLVNFSEKRCEFSASSKTTVLFS